MPIPETGTFYHYPTSQRFPHWGKTLPPGAAIGISQDKSYRLVGTINPDIKSSEVDAVLDAINDLQAAQRKAVELSVRLATIDAQLGQVASNKTLLEGDRVALQKNLDAAEKDLDEKSAKLRKTAIAPGIIIADWAIANSAGGSLRAGETFGLSNSYKKTMTGYIILGGLRISHLHVGDGIKHLILNLQPEDRGMLSKASVATYVLQAKHVRYVADSGVDAMFQAYAELSKDQLGSAAALSKLDKVRLAAYSAATSQLHNRGSLEGIQWSIREVDIGQELLGTNDLPEGWHTVQSMLTSGDRLFEHWKKTLGKASDLPIPELQSQRPGKFQGEITAFNQEIRVLNASLKNDRAYLAKNQVCESLRSLAEAIAAVNHTKTALADSFGASLTNSANQIDQALKLLDTEGGDSRKVASRSWSGLQNKTPTMEALLLHIDNATASLRSH